MQGPHAVQGLHTEQTLHVEQRLHVEQTLHVEQALHTMQTLHTNADSCCSSRLSVVPKTMFSSSVTRSSRSLCSGSLLSSLSLPTISLYSLP